MNDYMTQATGANSPFAGFQKIGNVSEACKAKGMAPPPNPPPPSPPPSPPPTNNTNNTNATESNGKGRRLLKASGPEATCTADKQCEWNATENKCDISDAEEKKIMGTSEGKMNEMQKKFETCHKTEATAKACVAPCALDGKHCTLGADAIIVGTFGNMPDGPVKTMVEGGMKCGFGSNETAATCKAKKIDGCTYNAGYKRCDYTPPDKVTADLMNAPVPGYAPECPSLMSKVTEAHTACYALGAAKCSSNSKCMIERDMCTLKQEQYYTIMAGEEDGKNMALVERTCSQHKNNDAACKAQTLDLDFFGKKYPSKKKVKTKLSFKNVKDYKEDKMKKAIAKSIGKDVKAEDIHIKKSHFPVKAKLKLNTTMATVNNDLPAFKAKFKKGAAKDLSVEENDIKITEIKARGERGAGGLGRADLFLVCRTTSTRVFLFFVTRIRMNEQFQI